MEQILNSATFAFDKGKKDYTMAQKYSTQDIRYLLIDYLLNNSVRKEMCLPILLMLGESREKMLQLMVYMRDNEVTEHEIIQKAIQLDESDAS